MALDSWAQAPHDRTQAAKRGSWCSTYTTASAISSTWRTRPSRGGGASPRREAGAPEWVLAAAGEVPAGWAGHVGASMVRRTVTGDVEEVVQARAPGSTRAAVTSVLVEHVAGTEERYFRAPRHHRCLARHVAPWQLPQRRRRHHQSLHTSQHKRDINRLSASSGCQTKMCACAMHRSQQARMSDATYTRTAQTHKSMSTPQRSCSSLRVRPLPCYHDDQKRGKGRTGPRLTAPRGVGLGGREEENGA